MDSGEVWTLKDVVGKDLYRWSSRNFHFRSVYDAVRRPIELWATENGSPEILVEQSVYGEQSAEGLANNVRGKEWQVKDRAGRVENKFDF